MPINKNYVPPHKLLIAKSSAAWEHYWQNDFHVKYSFTQYIKSIIYAIKNTKASRVVIIHKDRAVFLAALLAALQTNVVIVLPSLNTPGYLAEIIQKTDLLLNEEFLDNLEIIHTLDYEFTVIDPQVKQLIFYTSGSTGLPKMVNKLLIHIENELAALELLWGCTPDAKYYSTVSHAHLYGFLFSLLWPVCAAKQLARGTFSFWEEIFSKCSVYDYIISSPSHLGRFPPNQAQLIKCHYVFSSGALLTYNAANLSNKVLGHLPIEVFGSTETGGIAFRQQQTPEQLWSPFPNIQIMQTEEQLLALKSPYMDTEHAFYITQDIINLNNGQFSLRGRNDRIVKVEGKRVSLVDLENRLKKIPFIDILGAVIVLDAFNAQRLQTAGKLTIIREIKAQLLDFFELVSVPHKWCFVESIPSNSQGKRSKELIKSIGIKWN
jgi:acyl-coenzyme A synthetase/AMP-(fatty) acid ligase